MQCNLLGVASEDTACKLISFLQDTVNNEMSIVYHACGLHSPQSCPDWSFCATHRPNLSILKNDIEAFAVIRLGNYYRSFSVLFGNRFHLSLVCIYSFLSNVCNNEPTAWSTVTVVCVLLHFVPTKLTKCD